MKSVNTAKKVIIVSVGDTEFNFSPTVTDHNNYTNELMPDNKVAPAYTFLTRTVDSEQKDALIELLDSVPGLIMELFMEVNKGAKGGIKVNLKN
ncbi:putative phage tail assembly chaperone [Psychromonas ossibalaenae]|uniref:putative phage tail assembly chaperone n=1 Tax=Psychromonas ossibalaenae TaxID=444922 RepID=UPI000367E4B0|nr:putative phage tail assembly chaperone [Psychromonas ossibalaenae]